MSIPPSPQGPLSGHAVLVAGASSGMGRATAQTLAGLGADLVIAARRAPELAEVADRLRGGGTRVLCVPGDLADLEAALTAVDRATAEFGGLDAVVNCVGTNVTRRSLDTLSESDWRELFRVNVDAAFSLTRAALPALKRQGGGVLIHVSSSAAKRPDLSGVGYQAAKAAVAALAHAAMEEARADGVRISVIYPGFTRTPMIAKRPTPPTADQLAHALQPEDVAAMVAAILQLPPRAHVPELMLCPSRS
ncbi:MULTISPECIES: SDR family oxidoreductase [unclassified Streptomyces]|uniref:SDR family oxidoreductase n=1 Tax=unclassified Streptomyces TaxID=2593676 RepID=UPI002DD8FBC4|nr:SDR family oxidoreductase [Streptomyces sp. NBC_01257]WRZ69637.1 SDR family oxidoreductase [Streptomyces sp. NBC_01257]WSU63569.1 SDR family oxidoreductase [Streptomyces sp. NBC_01104]